ncbi:hypothetical protein D3C84_1016940 [compost metagenome]
METKCGFTKTIIGHRLVVAEQSLHQGLLETDFTLVHAIYRRMAVVVVVKRDQLRGLRVEAGAPLFLNHFATVGARG